jgi:hypothetical protein
MEKYFEKFPTVDYNGYTAKNIMLRTKILDKVYNNPKNFNFYELQGSSRPDNVAYNVYDDQYFSWLVYLSNNIVDPYYDWFFGEYEFDQYILKKYGSYDNAQGKVAYWSNNWYDDQNTLSVFYYNNTLADYAKKYYEPVFGGNTILEYRRKEDDWIVNTNQIWELTVTADISLALDDKVTIANSSSFNVANGQVLFANSSLIRIHQVFGSPNVNTGTVTYGSNTANVTATTLLARNIPLEEQSFWSPVTYYDVEDIKNAGKKLIKVVSPELSLQTALELQRALNP